MRKVILVPDSTEEGTSAARQYFDNFVARVRDALIRDGLACQLYVVRDVSHALEVIPASRAPEE